MEQIVLLLDQSRTATTYYQFPVSSEDYSNRESVSSEKNMMGTYFRNRITEAIKSKKQTKERFTENNIKLFPWNPSHTTRRNEGQIFFLSNHRDSHLKQSQNGSKPRKAQQTGSHKEQVKAESQTQTFSNMNSNSRATKSLEIK